MSQGTAVGGVVSTRLRRAGFVISPAANKHKRNGVFVSGGIDGRVSVLIRTGDVGRNIGTANDLMTTVTGWPQVSHIDTDSNGGQILVRFTYTPLTPSASKTGALHPRAKLSDANVREIRELHASTAGLSKFDPEKWTARRLAVKYGVAGPTISQIVHGKRRVL